MSSATSAEPVRSPAGAVAHQTVADRDGGAEAGLVGGHVGRPCTRRRPPPPRSRRRRRSRRRSGPSGRIHPPSQAARAGSRRCAPPPSRAQRTAPSDRRRPAAAAVSWCPVPTRPAPAKRSTPAPAGAAEARRAKAPAAPAGCNDTPKACSAAAAGPVKDIERPRWDWSRNPAAAITACTRAMSRGGGRNSARTSRGGSGRRPLEASASRSSSCGWRGCSDSVTCTGAAAGNDGRLSPNDCAAASPDIRAATTSADRSRIRGRGRMPAR